jgi:hypothetical protein
MLEADGKCARAYLRRNLTFPLDVEPWGGRRCAALPRYVECPATTVAYAISTLGPRAAVRPKSPCASCAALLWQTAPRRAIYGSDRPFSALRDHFLRHFQQPFDECENDALARLPAPCYSYTTAGSGLLQPARPEWPAGRPPARRARGVHALGFACMPACCARRRAAGCLACTGISHILLWLAG